MVLAMGAVSAQAHESHERRWRAQFGLGLPTSQSGKNLVGSSAGSFGLSYDLGGVQKGVWGLYTQGVMRNRERDNVGGGTQYSNQGIGGFGLQYRQKLESNPAVYFGGGIGGYSVSTSTSVKNGDTTTTTSTDKSVFGGRLFIGQEFRGRYFAELGYTLVGNARLAGTSVQGSHATVSVGFKF